MTRAAFPESRPTGMSGLVSPFTTRVGPWAPAALSAGLVAVAARPWGLGWLAWIALVPAFVAILRARTLGEGAGVAAVASLGLVGVAYEAVAGIGVWAYAPVCVVATLPFAAAGSAAVAFRRRLGGRAAAALLPLLWCAAEWLPAQPWLMGRWALTLGIIGYSQAGLPAMQLARFSSVTATSLTVVVGNVLLARWLAHRSARAAWALVALAALVAAAWWTRAAADTSAGAEAPHQLERVTVRLVQPHLMDSERAAAVVVPGMREALLSRLREASLRPAVGSPNDSHAVLTIWPEAAWPTRLRHDGHVASLSARDAAWLAGLGPLLLGGPARSGAGTPAGASGGTGAPAGASGGTGAPAPGGASGNAVTQRPSNAAFLWTGEALRHVYDKHHLVPIAEDGLDAGPGPAVIDVDGVAIAPAICYDAVLPTFARAAVRAGADLIAVLADDGFAARGDVPIQHLRVAAFRAVETGRPLAFASNTGPSAVVDAAGRVLARTEGGTQDALVATLGIGAGLTPYVRYGDWVGALVCLTLVGWTALAGARGGASRRPPPL